MCEVQLGKVVPVEAAISRDQLGRMMERMRRHEEVGHHAVPRLRGEFAVLQEDAAREELRVMEDAPPLPPPTPQRRKARGRR